MFLLAPVPTLITMSRCSHRQVCVYFQFVSIVLVIQLLSWGSTVYSPHIIHCVSCTVALWSNTITDRYLRQKRKGNRKMLSPVQACIQYYMHLYSIIFQCRESPVKPARSEVTFAVKKTFVHITLLDCLPWQTIPDVIFSSSKAGSKVRKYKSAKLDRSNQHGTPTI